jgi:hypothetical protein
MENDKIIKIHGSFIDLLDALEKINTEFINLTGLYNYIFMTQNNEYNYIIHNIENNNEIYTFQYYKNDKSIHNIPNAIFNPEEIYDFELNITKKTFKKIHQYTLINLNEFLMEIQIPEIKISKDKKKNKFCIFL